MTQFQNKTVFITGASDGIGKATTLECARQGATVIIHGKTMPKLEQLYDDMLKDSLPEPVIYPLDLEKITPDDCDTLNQVLGEQFGKLDALFINAGWLGVSAPVQQFDYKLWHQVMQINLNAAFMLTRACLPLLNNADKSSLLFNLDDKQTAYWGAYGVSKAGLQAFMNILADEIESSNINVTGLLPGIVNTRMRTRAYPGEHPETRTRVEDVARAAVFLLGDNGHTLEGKATHGCTFKLSELLTKLG